VLDHPRGVYQSFPSALPTMNRCRSLHRRVGQAFLRMAIRRRCLSPVEWAVAMQLCPNSTWRGEPCLPSWACKYSSELTGKAYKACGEATSAIHAMALLHFHQAKALKDLYGGGHDPQVLQELRAATNLHFVQRR
jgi:hypothetical protein